MNDLALGTDYKLEGEALNVFTYPAPVLKKLATEIEAFDADLSKLAKDMLYTMYKAPGIGLAAPQIGQSVRMFCIDTTFERERVTTAEGLDTFRYSNFNPKVLINPIIKEKHGEVVCQEGCLSFPGIFEDVKRAEKIVVEYHDLNGELITLETDGMESICIQHELDHLDGIVFIERLSQLKRSMLLKKFNKKKKKKRGFGV